MANSIGPFPLVSIPSFFPSAALEIENSALHAQHRILPKNGVSEPAILCPIALAAGRRGWNDMHTILHCIAPDLTRSIATVPAPIVIRASNELTPEVYRAGWNEKRMVAEPLHAFAPAEHQ